MANLLETFARRLSVTTNLGEIQDILLDACRVILEERANELLRHPGSLFEKHNTVFDLPPPLLRDIYLSGFTDGVLSVTRCARERGAVV